MNNIQTLALAASLLLPGGCSPEHTDCGYLGCEEEIMNCLRDEVAGVYDGVCTKEGAQKLVEIAKRKCRPPFLPYNFPDSEACQKDIRAAVNGLCELVHEDDTGLL